MKLAIEQPLEIIPKTSSVTIKKFKTLGLNSLFDLLNYFPYRYEDYSEIISIDHLIAERNCTIQGKIISFKNNYTRRGLTIQNLSLQDKTGSISLVWFNQPYLVRMLKVGMSLSVAGHLKGDGFKPTFEPLEYELITSDSNLTNTGRIVPVYSEKKGLSTKTVRDKIFRVIAILDSEKSTIPELLPEQILSYNNLVLNSEAYRQIHFPDSLDKLAEAKKKLGFDELFVLQLHGGIVKNKWMNSKAVKSITLNETQQKTVNEFINSLPFALTGSQKKVNTEISDDLKKTAPMNRLLQGEVGSGKTIVAGIAAYITFLNKLQTVIMAPTEILAHQHFDSLQKIFSGNAPSKKLLPKLSLITGSVKPSTNNHSDIIVGTHALLSKSVEFKKVGLMVIDEQQRFGVAQRALLKQKGQYPHLLSMTATPIPRTIALTVFRQLELSLIDEMPQGRIIVKSFFVPSQKRIDAYTWIKDKIGKENIQVFIVCPLIEESQSETLQSVKAAKKEYEYLQNTIFTHLKVGLLHGKMKHIEKAAMMEDFRNNIIQILVTTSVVEVGVDVPNATIMIIEGAERYGLSQLHQLRGRVGRGSKQSYCFLMTEKTDDAMIARLRFFAVTSSGITLSEYDLKHRGPGTMFGKEQHGYVDLKIASLSNYPLIEQTQKAADYFLKFLKLSDYPLLEDKIEKLNTSPISRD